MFLFAGFVIVSPYILNVQFLIPDLRNSLGGFSMSDTKQGSENSNQHMPEGHLKKMGGVPLETQHPEPATNRSPIESQEPNVKKTLTLRKKPSEVPQDTTTAPPPLTLQKNNNDAAAPLNTEDNAQVSSIENSDLFRFGEAFPQKAKIIIASIAAIFVIITIFINKVTFLPILALAFISLTAIQMLSRMPAFMKRFGMPGTRIILLLSLIFLSLCFTITTKSMGEGIKTYSQNLGYLTYYFEKGKQESAELVSDLHTKIDSDITNSTDATTQKKQIVSPVSPALSQSIDSVLSQRFTLWLQYILLLLSFVAFSLLPCKNFMDVKALTFLDQEQFYWQVASYSLGRLLRAPVIAGLFLIGLSFAGYDTAFLIASLTFLLTLYLPLGGILGLILALPMLGKTVYDGGSTMSISIVLLTVVLALVFEAKFNWLLMPFSFLKQGWLPLMLFFSKKKLKAQHTSESKLPLFAIARTTIHLSFTALVLFVAWRAYGIFQAYSAEKQSHTKHNEEFVNHPEESYLSLLELHKKSPSQRLLLAMSKTKLMTGDLKTSIDLAEQFSNWEGSEESPKEAPPSYLQKLDYYLYALLPKRDSGKFQGFEAQEFILLNHQVYIDDSYSSARLGKLILEQLKREPKNEAFLADLVFYYYYTNDLEKSNQIAQKLYGLNTTHCLKYFTVYALEEDKSSTQGRSSLALGMGTFKSQVNLGEKMPVYERYIKAVTGKDVTGLGGSEKLESIDSRDEEPLDLE